MPGSNSVRFQKGFSLIEVMVGATILLVAALAVAYLTKGRAVSKLDSLKACQDVNEEIMSAINSLGQGSFSYTYGTAGNYPKRECATCTDGELGLRPNLRWAPATALTTGTVRPTVRPHFLQLSSMNYLATLYNSNEAYCSVEGAPVPGAHLKEESSPFNFFQASDNAKNLLKDRNRYGSTKMSIHLVNETGHTSCTRPFYIRPQARGFGDTSPVLEKAVVDPAGAARVRIGFKVNLTTTYREAGASEDADPGVCTTTKTFFYQPEGYTGAITVNPVIPYPDPSAPLSSRGLPLCSSDDHVVAFTTTFTKAKRDSVLLCRNRSMIGTWKDPAPCDPTNPSSPNCKCDPGNGCHNTWPVFAGNPDGPPNPTLDSPNNIWFPCDMMGAQLVAGGILSSTDQVRVLFDPAGNGSYRFEVSDILHETPKSRPKLIRVDVIEVDSALNSSNDNTSAPFATFAANFMGLDPGEVCTDCDGNLAFMCGGCPGPCDCPSTANTCACSDYANANVCECNPTDPSCEPCAGITDPDELKCCQDPESCTKCRSCISWSTTPGTWSCGGACTVETCAAWEPGSDPLCPGDVSRSGKCSGANPCGDSCITGQEEIRSVGCTTFDHGGTDKGFTEILQRFRCNALGNWEPISPPAGPDTACAPGYHGHCSGNTGSCQID